VPRRRRASVGKATSAHGRGKSSSSDPECDAQHRSGPRVRLGMFLGEPQLWRALRGRPISQRFAPGVHQSSRPRRGVTCVTWKRPRRPKPAVPEGDWSCGGGSFPVGRFRGSIDARHVPATGPLCPGTAGDPRALRRRPGARGDAALAEHRAGSHEPRRIPGPLRHQLGGLRHDDRRGPAGRRCQRHPQLRPRGCRRRVGLHRDDRLQGRSRQRVLERDAIAPRQRVPATRLEQLGDGEPAVQRD